MSNQEQPRTTLIISMLIGGLLGILTGIGIAMLTGSNVFIGVGPAAGTIMGMSIGLVLEERRRDHDDERG